MDIILLLKEVKKGKIDPVYLLHGSEFFLISQIVSQIKDLVAIGPMADCNYSRKKISETSGVAIVAEAKSLPMMASQRLIIIDDCEKLKSSDLSALEPYLENPSPETCLILIGSKFDLRRGLFSKSNKRKQVHKAEPLKEREILAFIKQRAKDRKVMLGKGADLAISNAVGSDCAALDDAIERVGLYAYDKPVSESDIAKVVSSIRQHSVFELVDAMGIRNQAKALTLLEEFLARREEPLRLCALLARHMRQLIFARIMAFKNVHSGDMAKSLGVPPFVANKLVAQSKGFRGTQLENALARLARADLELKSSRRPSGLVLEDAVIDLCLGI